MANAEIASAVVSVVCLKQGLLSEVVYFLSLPFPVVEMNFYTGHRSTQCHTKCVPKFLGHLAEVLSS